MSEIAEAPAVWTCPFCPLACDDVSVHVSGGTLALQGGDCPRASQYLAGFADPPAPASPEVDGRAASLDDAIAAAVQHLRASRQPLLAGLGCDVAGARALFTLASATGAISDAAGGDALMHGLRALQDRGQFTTTLAEVKARGDVIVFVGGLPGTVAPRIRERLGIGSADVPARHVVVLGPRDGDEAVLAGWQGVGVTVQVLPLEGDLFDTLPWLEAALAGRLGSRVPAPMQALAARLRAAHYAVLVGTPALLPAHGALVVEAVHRIVGHLNQTTRAAALWLGGGNGAATANQVFAWLSGLPLRSRAGPRGLEHEPLLYGSTRLLQGGAVDALLWVSAFLPDALPPPAGVPAIVLGHPAQAAACRRSGCVFIPVATPGVGSGGHIFRTDGTVLMPLHAARADALPTVAAIATRLHAGLQEATA